MSGRRALLASPFLLATPAFAQDDSFPSRPPRFIVPFPPGGSVDTTARILAEGMRQVWRVAPVVENRAGATGIIGTEMAARAPADGYTLLLGSVATLAINPAIRARLPYDAERDFSPVARLTDVPNVVVVGPSVAATSIAELVALAKARPDSLTYASAGVGTSNHMAGELFQQRTGTQLRHVPINAGGTATEIIAGRIDLAFDNLPTCWPHVEAGRLRALAVTSPARAASAPMVPTLIELGVPDFDVQTWVGLFAPSATPAPLVAAIRAGVVTALAQPEVVDRMTRQGADIAAASAQAGFADYLAMDRRRWKEVAATAGLRDIN